MREEEFKLLRAVKIWNLTASVFFLVICLIMFIVFQSLKPVNFVVTIFDLIILSLANFRLVRLFIYDNITVFLREIFMDLKIRDNLDGIKIFDYIESKNSFKFTLHKLLQCPWCFGIWTSFISSFFYFTFPELQIVFIVLAISALASFSILLSNLIGWTAEEKKIKVEKKN